MPRLRGLKQFEDVLHCLVQVVGITMPRLTLFRVLHEGIETDPLHRHDFSRRDVGITMPRQTLDRVLREGIGLFTKNNRRCKFPVVFDLLEIETNTRFFIDHFPFV